MSKRKKLNLKIIDSLKERSLEAFQQGYSLESALIIFQLVDRMLRIAVSGFARGHDVSEEINAKCSEEKQRFARLIIYYELLKPNNNLTKRLQEFNNKRNSIIHKIFFDFESINSLQSELNAFVMEGVKLNNALRKGLLT